jgi:hypothetical protein
VEVADEIERSDAVVIAGDRFPMMMQERERRRASVVRDDDVCRRVASITIGPPSCLELRSEIALAALAVRAPPKRPDASRLDPKRRQQASQLALRQPTRALIVSHAPPLAPQPILQFIERRNQCHAGKPIGVAGVEDATDIVKQNYTDIFVTVTLPELYCSVPRKRPPSRSKRVGN